MQSNGSIDHVIALLYIGATTDSIFPLLHTINVEATPISPLSNSARLRKPDPMPLWIKGVIPTAVESTEAGPNLAPTEPLQRIHVPAAVHLEAVRVRQVARPPELKVPLDVKVLLLVLGVPYGALEGVRRSVKLLAHDLRGPSHGALEGVLEQPADLRDGSAAGFEDAVGGYHVGGELSVDGRGGGG